MVRLFVLERKAYTQRVGARFNQALLIPVRKYNISEGLRNSTIGLMGPSLSMSVYSMKESAFSAACRMEDIYMTRDISNDLIEKNIFDEKMPSFQIIIVYGPVQKPEGFIFPSSTCRKNQDRSQVLAF
jgi:hypothetical protein